MAAITQAQLNSRGSKIYFRNADSEVLADEAAAKLEPEGTVLVKDEAGVVSPYTSVVVNTQVEQDTKITALEALKSQTVNQSATEAIAEMEAGGRRMTTAGVAALKAWSATVTPTAEIDATWNAVANTLDFTDGTTTEAVPTELAVVVTTDLVLSRTINAASVAGGEVIIERLSASEFTVWANDGNEITANDNPAGATITLANGVAHVVLTANATVDFTVTAKTPGVVAADQPETQGGTVANKYVAPDQLAAEITRRLGTLFARLGFAFDAVNLGDRAGTNYDNEADLLTLIDKLIGTVEGLPDQIAVATYADLPAVGTLVANTIVHVSDASGGPDVADAGKWAKYQVIGGAYELWMTQDDLADVVTLTNAEMVQGSGDTEYDAEKAGTVTVKGLDAWQQSRYKGHLHVLDADTAFVVADDFPDQNRLYLIKADADATITSDSAIVANDVTSTSFEMDAGDQALALYDGTTLFIYAFVAASTFTPGNTRYNTYLPQGFQQLSFDFHDRRTSQVDIRRIRYRLTVNELTTGNAEWTLNTDPSFAGIAAIPGYTRLVTRYTGWDAGIDRGYDITLDHRTVGGETEIIIQDSYNENVNAGNAQFGENVFGAVDNLTTSGVAPTVDASSPWSGSANYVGNDNVQFSLVIPESTTRTFTTNNGVQLSSGTYNLIYASDRLAADSPSAILDDDASVAEVALMNYVGLVTTTTSTEPGNAITLSVTLDGNPATIVETGNDTLDVTENVRGQFQVQMSSSSRVINGLSSTNAAAILQTVDISRGVIEYLIPAGAGNTTIELTSAEDNANMPLIFSGISLANGTVVDLGMTLQTFVDQFDAFIIEGARRGTSRVYTHTHTLDTLRSRMATGSAYSADIGGKSSVFAQLAGINTVVHATDTQMRLSITHNTWDIYFRGIRGTLLMPGAYSVPALRTISLDPTGSVTTFLNGQTSIQVRDGMVAQLAVTLDVGNRLALSNPSPAPSVYVENFELGIVSLVTSSDRTIRLDQEAIA